jgi:hypothetical protein
VGGAGHDEASVRRLVIESFTRGPLEITLHGVRHTFATLVFSEGS